jgi:hypothetical protein
MKPKPTPKRETGRGATFAKGGKGAPNKMLPELPAEPANPGRTGRLQTRAPGAIKAAGGPKIRGHSVSAPAVGGHTAPIVSLRKGKGRGND